MKKFMAIAIVFAMILTVLPAMGGVVVLATATVVELDGDLSGDTNFDDVTGVYTVPAGNGEFVFTMENPAQPTDRIIVVSTGFDGVITLDNVHILNETYDFPYAFRINAGSTVELNLVGESSIHNINPAFDREDRGAIFVQAGAELIINSERTIVYDYANPTYVGSLDVQVGRGFVPNTQTIVFGTAIGGFGNGAHMHGGAITINGGEINILAFGQDALAIGAGHSGSVGAITINGGNIVASNHNEPGSGGNLAPTIGNGRGNGDISTIEITGGRLTLGGSARIGDGNNRQNGDVIITGGYIVPGTLNLNTNAPVNFVHFQGMRNFVVTPEASLGLTPHVTAVANAFYLNARALGTTPPVSIITPNALRVEAWDADGTTEAFADFSSYNALLSAVLPAPFGLGASTAVGINRVWTLNYFNSLPMLSGAEVEFSATGFDPVVWETAFLEGLIATPRSVSVIFSNTEVPDTTLSTFAFSSDLNSVNQSVPGWTSDSEGDFNYQATLPLGTETITLDIAATDSVNAIVTVAIDFGSGWTYITGNTTDIALENDIFNVKVTVSNGVLTSTFTVLFATLMPPGMFDISLGDIGGLTFGSHSPGGFPISNPTGTYTIVQRVPGATNNTIYVPRGFRGTIILDGVDIINTEQASAANNNRAPISLAHATLEADRVDLTLVIRGENRLQSGTPISPNSHFSGILVPQDSAITIEGYCDNDSVNVLNVSSRGSAAIGGNNVAVHTRVSGQITIESGTINAQVVAGQGAAIGGGAGAGSRGFVTINGGNITAVADGSPAIGGGGGNNAAARVIINNGTIHATGGGNLPGIGNGGGIINRGAGEFGGEIIINGGDITSISGGGGGQLGGAGLGGGLGNVVDRIEINGGTVRATGTRGAGNNDHGAGAGIGAGGRPQAGHDNVVHGEIIITGGDIIATGGLGAPGIGGGFAPNGTTRYPIASITILPGANLGATTIGGFAPATEIFYLNPRSTAGIGGVGENTRRLWAIALNDDENMQAFADFSAFDASLDSVSLGDSLNHDLGRIWRLQYFSNMTGAGNVVFTADNGARIAEITTSAMAAIPREGRYVFLLAYDETDPGLVMDYIPAPAVPITNIQLTLPALRLPSNFVSHPTSYGGATIPYRITPENAENQTIRWESTNPSVVSIDESTGVFTVHAHGVAGIIAHSTDGSFVSSAPMIFTIYDDSDIDLWYGAPWANLPVAQWPDEIRNLRNLPPVAQGTNRLANGIEYHLAMPTNVGEARVALWHNNATSVLTVTSDDNGNTINSNAAFLQLTNETGIRVSHMIEGASLGQPVRNASNTLMAAGHEIQCHSLTHGSALYIGGAGNGGGPGQACFHSNNGPGLVSILRMHEFTASRHALENAFGRPAITHAYEGNSHHGGGDIARDFYASLVYIAARTVSPGFNIAGSINYMRVNRISDANAGHFPFGVQNVMTRGNWSVVLLHGLDGGDIWFLNNVGVILPFIESGELWPGLFSEVARYSQSRDTSSLDIVQEDVANGIFRFHVRDRMSDRYFDFPLTVNIKVDDDFTDSSEWQEVTATQAGVEIPATIVRRAGEGTFVVVNAVPDRGEVVVLRGDVEPPPIAEFTAINVINNGEGVTLSGINTTDEPLTAVVILAMYDGYGRFLDAFIQNVSIEPVDDNGIFTNQPVVWTGRTPVRPPNADYEVFLWDSLVTMVPRILNN